MSLMIPEKGEQTIFDFKDGLTLEIVAIQSSEDYEAVVVSITIGTGEPELISMPVGSTLKSDLKLTIGG